MVWPSDGKVWPSGVVVWPGGVVWWYNGVVQWRGAIGVMVVVKKLIEQNGRKK